jgi:hypothetical protein
VRVVLVESGGDLFGHQLALGRCAIDGGDTYAGHCEGLACERSVWGVVGAVVVGGEEKSSEVVKSSLVGRDLIGQRSGLQLGHFSRQATTGRHGLSRQHCTRTSNSAATVPNSCAWVASTQFKEGTCTSGHLQRRHLAKQFYPLGTTIFFTPW